MNLLQESYPDQETQKARKPPPWRSWWRETFAGPLRALEEKTRHYINSASGSRPDYKTMIVLVTVAVTLTIQRYIGLAAFAARVVENCEFVLGPEMARSISGQLLAQERTRIGSLFFWAMSCVLTYFVIPSLVIRFVLRERLGDYGLKLRGASAGLGLYCVMLAVMGPLVYWMSSNAHFQATYPFYPLERGERLWPDFWRWELLYAVQFFALEFLFRGFMVHGTKHRFGAYSVFVMTIPYCMIHFGKPVQETCAAIVAGIVLGVMSLKTRSIWMGALLHVSVALSMDFASLWRKGFFD